MPQQHKLGIWVEVHGVRGSTPREVGAWMWVGPDGLFAGTVGGGHLEFDAIAQAQNWIACHHTVFDEQQHLPFTHTYKLGPNLGQCCGGEVVLQFTPLAWHVGIDILQQREHSQRLPVTLFGAGHIGHALIAMGQHLPIDWWWIDSREGIFPSSLSDSVRCEHSTPVHDAVDDAVQGRHVLIMSFSHAEDFDVLERILLLKQSGKAALSIGLIGSSTKWSSFRSRLLRKGYSAEHVDSVRCPVGWSGLSSKEPAVVALSVLAELMTLNPSTGN